MHRHAPESTADELSMPWTPGGYSGVLAAWAGDVIAKDGRFAFFFSNGRKVVEGACPQLARRFPPGRALKRLEEECDALVEEHEQALVLYLTASQPGGGDLEPMAQLTKCDLASAPVWRSPWATRSAVGAAREAVENNATAPSELVKRLTQLTQDRVFDAELDPEGWGRKEEGAAAAAAAPTAAKGKKSKKKKKKGASRDEL